VRSHSFIPPSPADECHDGDEIFAMAAVTALVVAARVGHEGIEVVVGGIAVMVGISAGVDLVGTGVEGMRVGRCDARRVRW